MCYYIYTVKKRKKRGCFITLSVFLIILIPAIYFFYHYYTQIFKQHSLNISKDHIYIFIPTGSDFNMVENILYDNDVIFNRQMFEWVAEQKNYPNHVHPGRYKIAKKMSLNALINMLRSGNQKSVRITINSNIRLVRQVAAMAGKKLETDSAKIMTYLQEENYLEKNNFDRYTLISMFIPNTYEFLWNTSVEEFVDRMKSEYFKFWNEERIDKAKKMGFTKSQIITLASIVQLETLKSDEKKRIAGVYINRLKKGMLLQADPTVIYANGNFEIHRVTKVMTQIDSPYNTYRNTGLPPGPICIPAISTIDAVLNYEHHDYIYFCAKEDFSGYHNFAKTLSQHNVNAKKYQKALNKRKIYR